MAQAASRMNSLLNDELITLPSAGPAVADLSYRGLRFWGLSEQRLARYVRKKPKPLIQALMALSWSALHDHLRPDHVIVDEAVKAAKKLEGPAAGGFVNALLRRTLAEPTETKKDLSHPIAAFNAPLWWIKKIERQYGIDAASVLSALNSRPPLTVRLASEALPVMDYLAALKQQGLEGVQVGPRAVSIRPPVPVAEIPLFAEGWVSVQDAAAQWAAEDFELPEAEEMSSRPVFLDACAAPGGKAVSLAQNYAATIWAMDLSAPRLNRLRQDLPRVLPTLRGEICPVLADVLRPETWPDPLAGQAFDAILLDAPCSASGVARRHPEIPWRRTEADVQRAAEIQTAMLHALWPRLKEGGELRFVTCSVFEEEGERQQQAFLARTPNAVLLDSPGRVLPQCQPDQGIDQDGFYYARFQKIRS